MDSPRRLASVLGLLALPLLLTGCTASSQAEAQRGTAVVIFVDFSDSIGGQDRQGYKREIEKQILPWLQPGDSIVIAPIHDKTLTEFRPLVEAELPPRPQFNGWLNNVMKYKKEATNTDARIVRVKEQLRTQTAEAMTRHYQARYTDIFSSLLLAEKLFSAEQRHKVLILMSDMIEDYPPYAFDRMTWTANTTPKVLTDLEAKRMIADLSRVCIYVSGVSAPNPELARNIGAFWEAYFKKAGADLHPARYAHVLLHWPPPTSCRATQWGQRAASTAGAAG
jgi:hypothetical protein